MLRFNTSDRLSLTDCLNHPFIKSDTFVASMKTTSNIYTGAVQRVKENHSEDITTDAQYLRLSAVDENVVVSLGRFTMNRHTVMKAIVVTILPCCKQPASSASIALAFCRSIWADRCGLRV